MRSVRSVLVVPGAILALLAGACGDASELPGATRADLAAEVEHVAGLVEAGQPCQALEAVRLLESLASRADDDEARAAVDRFTDGVRGTVTCDPDDADTEDATDDANGGGGGNGGDDSKDRDDKDDDRPPPGRGRGRGN